MNIELTSLLNKLYNYNVDEQLKRYKNLLDLFNQKYSKKDYKFFSAPGRTEICGNHTDHNHGKVVAASINLDSIAIASQNNKSIVNLISVGYDKPFSVNLKNLKPVKEEKESTESLIRGVAAGFVKHGYKIGGFDAVIQSDVIVGSGLSSSASIEVLIGSIFNQFYNKSKITLTEIAIIGQFAENNFFGKPCGLMDQVACATGGIITIDFNDPKNPLIKKIDFDFNSTGYKLIVVDTEASHADLTEDYASIPKEMKLVAKYFGKEFLSEIGLKQLFSKLKPLRKKLGDRAVLRAIHFLEENKRVDRLVESLNGNNFTDFLSIINESGNSSYKYLQNIYSTHNFNEQGVSIALALSDMFIQEHGVGASRVHGGGFAGTIQVFLPKELVDKYTNFISNAFDRSSVKVLSIRNYGAVCLDEL